MLNNKTIEEIKTKHEQIRQILINYGSVEYGDVIIDEICEIIGYPTTKIYFEE